MRSLPKLLAILALVPTAALAQPNPGWSERGVFVFGRTVLDFQLERAVVGPKFVFLRDCSTAEFYCAGGALQLVLPRSCETFRRQSAWSLDGATTRRLYEDGGEEAGRKSSHITARPIHLLGDAAQPYRVYLYSEGGVFALYEDASRRLDLVALAARGDVEALAAATPWRDQLYQQLITFDPMGPCRER